MGIHRRRGGLRITKKGLRYRAPSFRIGNRKSGVNVSKSGLSYSGKVGPVNVNSKRGCSMTGCILPVLAVLLGFFIITY